MENVFFPFVANGSLEGLAEIYKTNNTPNRQVARGCDDGGGAPSDSWQFVSAFHQTVIANGRIDVEATHYNRARPTRFFLQL